MKLTCDEKHIYKNDLGERYIGMTSHLQIAGLVDFSMCRQEDLNFAALRGQHVHRAHYLYLLDDLEIGSLDEAYKGYCEAFIKFYKEHNVEVWDSESIVSCDSLKTAGSFDLACLFNGSGAIVEFKTSVTMPKTTGIQTAGYKVLWNDKKRKRLIILRYGVHLLKTGKYKIYQYADRRDGQIFKNIVSTNWWALSNGIIPVGAKNSENIYNLCKEIIKG